MTNWMTSKSWSPYVVGASIGVLSWFAFVSADHPLGFSTAFETTGALTLQMATPSVTEQNMFFTEHDPKIGWEWMLVLGVFFGSLTSSLVSGDRETFTCRPCGNRVSGRTRPSGLRSPFSAA